MKRIKLCMLFLVAIVFCYPVFAQVTVTGVTTTNNARYSPRNCLAIWIQNSGGGFVKTIHLRSATRTQYLYSWVARSGWQSTDGYQNIDGWSGATRTNHNGSVVGTWDLTDYNGNQVPEGTYEFWCEFTEEHAQGPMASGTIIIDNQAKTVNISSTYITLEAVYSPVATDTPSPTPISTSPPTSVPTSAPTSAPTAVPVTPVPTIVPTLAPPSDPTPVPNLLGDLNGSGVVDIVDALLISQYYVGLNPANINLVVADVDCSGMIDIVDALLVAQYYVSLISAFPCVNPPASAPASDDVYYVSPAGNDANPGTETSPWRTIQKASRSVVPGNTVYIMGGTYNEKITFTRSGTASDYITFRNYNNDTVVIDGSGISGDSIINLGSKAYIKVTGLEVAQNTEADGSGVSITGGKFITLENNSIHHCDIGIKITSEIYEMNSKGIVVVGNIIYSNNQAGIVLGGTEYGVTGRAINCHIFNNVLYNNDINNSSQGEIRILQATFNQIKNNIFSAPGHNLVLSTQDRGNDYNIFDFNLWYCNSGVNNIQFKWNQNTYTGYSTYLSASGQDLNSVFGDPAFAGASASYPDFHLLGSSPAIDTGNPAFAPGGIDRDGNERINGTRVDIGAYEFYEK